MSREAPKRFEWTYEAGNGAINKDEKAPFVALSGKLWITINAVPVVFPDHYSNDDIGLEFAKLPAGTNAIEFGSRRMRIIK